MPTAYQSCNQNTTDTEFYAENNSFKKSYIVQIKKKLPNNCNFES